MHIVIDVLTHSADFYPSPVLYPITQQGVDAWAWNNPWLLMVNYIFILILWITTKPPQPH